MLKKLFALVLALTLAAATFCPAVAEEMQTFETEHFSFQIPADMEYLGAIEPNGTPLHYFKDSEGYELTILTASFDPGLFADVDSEVAKGLTNLYMLYIKVFGYGYASDYMSGIQSSNNAHTSDELMGDGRNDIYVLMGPVVDMTRYYDMGDAYLGCYLSMTSPNEHASSTRLVGQLAQIADYIMPLTEDDAAGAGRPEYLIGSNVPEPFNVYSGPGTDHDVLHTADENQLLDCIGQEGDWYLVNLGSKVGYASVAECNLYKANPDGSLDRLDAYPAKAAPAEAEEMQPAEGSMFSFMVPGYLEMESQSFSDVGCLTVYACPDYELFILEEAENFDGYDGDPALAWGTNALFTVYSDEIASYILNLIQQNNLARFVELFPGQQAMVYALGGNSMLAQHYGDIGWAIFVAQTENTAMSDNALFSVLMTVGETARRNENAVKPQAASGTPANNAGSTEDAPDASSATEAAPAAPKSEVIGTVTVTGSSANIRSGPGAEYTKLFTAYQGDTFPLLGRIDNWYIIDAKGQTGFIAVGLSSIE